MSKKKQNSTDLHHLSNDHLGHAREIEKILSKVEATGQRPYQIFSDWLELIEAALKAMPAHLTAAARGEMHQDDEETAALWARMRTRYGDDDPKRNKRYFTLFAKAFAILFEASTTDYMDVIGAVYMSYGWPSKGAGQFFTPWHVAQMMAQMTIGDGRAQVFQQLGKAARETKDLMAQATLMASYAIRDAEQAEQHLIYNVIPMLAPTYEPIKISDPCCGSGVMFLAAAQCFPWWAVSMGLVQFYGQDIDLTCVRMATVNSRLYGLNGCYAEHVLAMSNTRFREVVPEPWQEPYEIARQAHAVGDVATVNEIENLLRRAKANPSGTQGTLFEPRPTYHTQEVVYA